MNVDKLIESLKSATASERKAAAEKLQVGDIGPRAIQPLFDALMNWKEEKDTLKEICIALFINLWGRIDSRAKKEISEQIRANPQQGSLVLHGVMSRLLEATALGNQSPNPGQTERISLMLRTAWDETWMRGGIVLGKSIGESKKWWKFWE